VNLIFTGWSLTQVLGLFAGVGAAVTALYFLKMRRRAVEVPFLPLWEALVAEERRTRLFDRLKRWWSLLLALLVVAALSSAVGDPRAAGARSAGRTLVVLVDASASMKGTDVAPNRFEAARKALGRLIDDLGPRDRMLIAEMTGTTTPMSPLTGELSVLRDARDALAAQDTGARLDRALGFAADVLRDQPDPEVVVVTDGRLDLGVLASAPSTSRAGRLLGDPGVRFSWIPVGTRDARNVAITSFAVRRYPLDKSQTEVLLEAWNPGETPRTVELQLVSEAGPVEVVPLDLPPGERVRRFFRNVSGADQTLEARLLAPPDAERRAPDDLPVDDRAYARLPERRRARVQVVTPGNLYLEAALLLDEYLDVTQVAPGDYPAPGAFDVVIFDGVLPPAPPATHAIYLGPGPETPGVAPIQLTDELVPRPYFDEVDDDHPLTRFTALENVNIAEAWRVGPAPDDQVVGSDRRGAPLLVTGRRGDHGFVLLPFDLARSDLPLRVAWPLLLLHAIDLFVAEEAGFRSSFATGEVWRIPVPGEAAGALIYPPGEATSPQRAPVEDGRAVHLGTQVGFHRLVPIQTAALPGQGAEPVTPQAPAGTADVVAANLGPGLESEPATPEALVVAGRRAGEPSRGSPGARQEPWVWLAALALGIVALEWLAYHRRWTV